MHDTYGNNKQQTTHSTLVLPPTTTLQRFGGCHNLDCGCRPVGAKVGLVPASSGILNPAARNPALVYNAPPAAATLNSQPPQMQPQRQQQLPRGCRRQQQRLSGVAQCIAHTLTAARKQPQRQQQLLGCCRQQQQHCSFSAALAGPLGHLSTQLDPKHCLGYPYHPCRPRHQHHRECCCGPLLQRLAGLALRTAR